MMSRLQMIRQSLMKSTNIILYGEGWDMGNGLAPYDKTKRKTTPTKCQNIGLKTISAMLSKAEKYMMLSNRVCQRCCDKPILAKAILGSRELNLYIQISTLIWKAHDNYNLHDLLATLHPDQSSEQIMRKVGDSHSYEPTHARDVPMEIGQILGTKLVT